MIGQTARMPDVPERPASDPGTPLHDAVLTDRLEAAARSVAVAMQDATAFRQALDAGQRAALAQQAEQQARTLTAVATATLTARLDALERQVRWSGDRLAVLAAWHTGDTRCQVCGEVVPCTTARVLVGDPAPVRRLAVVPTPAAAASTPTLQEQAVAFEAAARPLPVEAAPEPVDAACAEPCPDAVPVRPAPVEAVRDAPSRSVARDGGPAAAEVPSVPSMKDLFAGTRAAGWLDSLLGAKR